MSPTRDTPFPTAAAPLQGMASRIAHCLAMAWACLALAACSDRTVQAAPDATPAALTVFAAASLKDALDAAAASYRVRTGQTVQVSYAASSALARQIEQGAPADVFLSADAAWMDWLQQRALVDPASRRDLLGNTLVLVAPASGDARPFALARGAAVLPLLGEHGRLALARTDGVPAGRYARTALEALGLWQALAPRAAESENVRAALLLVARGEAPLGIVYASDARAEPRVRVLATFPETTHPPITYPAARVTRSRHPAAVDFIAWLESAEAGAVFRDHGFSLH